MAKLTNTAKHEIKHEQPKTEKADETDETAEFTDNIWEKHVFVCTGGKHCAEVDGDGLGVHAALKRQVALAGLRDRVRVNHAGCLDQCGFGPLVVVYPETVWYAGVRPEDVEEIVREHLVGGRPVERLRYRNRPGKNKLPRDEQNRPIGRPARHE
jgi:(2Fe-2S) ferredoxin